MKKNEKKKISAETVFGLLSKLYGENKNFVLQDKVCIAT